jgi:TatD DNase family protein
MFSNDPFIDIHTHQVTSHPGTISLISSDYHNAPEQGKYYSYGIHPWYIEQNPLNESLPILMQAVSSPQALAVGEAGLDRFIGMSFELQEKYFKAQITVSEYYKKPMIIHCVKAYSDIQEIRKAGKFKMPWVIHGFNANKQTADQMIKMGFFLSFGKALLDPESKAALIFPLIPMKSIFLETDDADIDIKDIYATAAGLRKISLEQLKQKIAENARVCFK